MLPKKIFFFIYNLFLILTNVSSEGNSLTSIEIFSAKNISSPISSKVDNSENKINMDNSVLEPSVDLELNMDVVKDNVQYKGLESNIVVEQSDVSKEMLNNEPPIFLSLSESSSIDFEKLVDHSVITASREEENETKDASINIEIVTENVSYIRENNSNLQMAEDITEVVPERNATEQKNEDIPSFSEWAQKRLEEVEKSEQINSSSKGQTTNGKGLTAKLRWKNYASLDCGAKVIAANPESISPGAILSPSTDEYKLNPCTSRIWFIVELCEAIQIKRIDLANYELFSSSPKDFTVSVSDRYPTRDWSLIGKFTAQDERDIQSFDLYTDIFGKYVKVDIKTHYGSEHYCPISLFRVYGTSVFEVLQKEDPAHVSPADDDDDDDAVDDSNITDNDIIDDDANLAVATAEKKNENLQKNLFSSATDAVISIVKKAAEVLGNTVNNQTTQEKINGTRKSSPLVNTCTTPRHMIFCDNCDDILFEGIYELLSCKTTYIKKLVVKPVIYKALSNSLVCGNFYYELNSVNPHSNSFTGYVISFFPFKYIGAMCNEISVMENRSVLNSSQQFSNITGNITHEKYFMLKIYKPRINNSESKVTKIDKVYDMRPTDSLFLNHSNEVTISKTDSSNFTNISQIKPTKASMDTEISKTDTNLTATKSIEEQDVNKISSEYTDTFSSKSIFEGITESPIEMDVSEAIDVLDAHLEHFISEFNADYGQNPTISPSTTTNSPQAQKESIFLRLSNRIKTLERNMSLSSQYLEELSKRYKKQVEEMQNLLENTIMSLREESLKKDLRNKQLEDRLNNLTTLIESLVDERRNWFLTIFWLTCSVISICGIYFFCGKSSTCKSARNAEEAVAVLYHQPINAINYTASEKKKRRPSDQAMKILNRSTSNTEDRNKFIQRQRKRKKKHTLKRSNSIGNIEDKKSHSKEVADWIENSHQIIEDIRFVLDESDHSTLEAYPLENEVNRVESSVCKQPPFNFKFNTSSSQFNENEIIVEKSNINNSERKLSNSNNSEPMKKEKKTLKNLFKKVF